MKKDLSKMKRDELEDLKLQVEKALVEVAENDRKVALAAAVQAALDHGFSLEELTNPVGKRKGLKGVKSSGPAKYSNPAKPDQTWTGKGRQPRWFKAAVESGVSAESMEV